MNISVVKLIQLGQQYLKLWPEKAELANYFSDYRAVQTARFVCRYFPALALFTVVMQLYFSSGLFFSKDVVGQTGIGQAEIDKALAALPQALVYGLFILSLPVQALVVSGVKADTLLPPSLASWYRSGLEKAKQQQMLKKTTTESGFYNQTKDQNQSENNHAIQTINQLTVNKPRYIDLAQLLQLTFATKS